MRLFFYASSDSMKSCIILASNPGWARLFALQHVLTGDIVGPPDAPLQDDGLLIDACVADLNAVYDRDPACDRYTRVRKFACGSSTLPRPCPQCPHCLHARALS